MRRSLYKGRYLLGQIAARSVASSRSLSRSSSWLSARWLGSAASLLAASALISTHQCTGLDNGDTRGADGASDAMMAIPQSNTHVSLEPSDSPTVNYASVRAVCRELVVGWAAVRDEDIEVVQVKGGITNILLKVTRKNGHTDGHAIVLVRIYGPNTDLFIDRQQENNVFAQLTHLGFGPGLLALFENGRIEEWFEARTLEPCDLADPVISHKIAARLAQFHQLPVRSKGDKQAILWDKLTEWSDLAAACDFSDDERKAERFKALDLPGIGGALADLKVLLDRTPSPIVYAHNDTLAGNIMLQHDGEQRLEFVDLEYGGHNFRGFDIGNHFCEFAGFDYGQIHDVYPTKAAQYAFFKSYLAAGPSGRATEQEMHDMFVEVNRYALASHMFWGLWAVVQARHSSLDFDYLTYAQQRFDAFYSFRSKFEDL